MRRTGVTGALVLLLAVAGCTSSGGTGPSSSAAPSTPPTSSSPVTSSTPPTSSSSTPSPATSIPTTGPNVRPGEKAPQRPAVANDSSRAGAIALSIYWIRTIDWGYATTSSALSRTVYAATCKDCADFMVDFDRAQKLSYRFRDGRIAVQQASIVSDDHRYAAAQRVADVAVTVDKLVVVNSKGATVASVPAVHALTYRVWMRWTAGRGQIIQFREVVRK